jgi:hypothetical protein
MLDPMFKIFILKSLKELLGKVGITGDTMIGDLKFPDNVGTQYGTGTDMEIIYDGTQGIIDTSLVAPSDLLLKCGAGKTFVLDSGVYDDWVLTGIVLDGTGASAPDIVTTANGMKYRSFDGNNTTEQLFGTQELLHDWEEESAIEVHAHIKPSTTATGKIRFEFSWNIAKKDTVTNVATWDNTDSDFIEITTNNQYFHKYISICTMTMTGYHIGDIIEFRLRRVPTDTDDTYPNDVYLIDLGFHYKKDTLGSRTTTGK